METAKVDIRKLQLLNDRINQCIDALNQVRLSVHGLSHTTAAPPFPGAQAGFLQAGINPLAQNPGIGLGYANFGQVPVGQIPVGQFPLTQAYYIPGPFPGAQAGFLQAGINPLAQNPGIGLGYANFGQVGQIPVGQFPLTQAYYIPGLSHTAVPVPFPGLTSLAGLSHTTAEQLEGLARPLWADPFLAARIAQTFPYIQFAVSPAVPIY